MLLSNKHRIDIKIRIKTRYSKISFQIIHSLYFFRSVRNSADWEFLNKIWNVNKTVSCRRCVITLVGWKLYVIEVVTCRFDQRNHSLMKLARRISGGKDTLMTNNSNLQFYNYRHCSLSIVICLMNLICSTERSIKFITIHDALINSLAKKL